MPIIILGRSISQWKVYMHSKVKNARVLLVFTCSAERTKRQIKRNLFQLAIEFICFHNANGCKFMGKGLIGLSLLFMAQSWIPAFEIPNPNSNIEAPNVATKPCNQLPNFDFYFAKRKITRPSVNHAKDYIGQLFLIPGLVWERVSPMDVITLGQSTTIFLCDNHTAKLPTVWS